jgi:hypothetical protein
VKAKGRRALRGRAPRGPGPGRSNMRACRLATGAAARV